ncbi:hypothetical protein [Symbioplanes lichenis]|uniref:hypothetical protein n=1 Tax=Symbioplanes lichenis TaxID=1629072 RepID=UPI002739014D|nr:hypothetical protein [Actinoplanes lichenis]
MTEAFTESAAVLPGAALCQGDVFVFLDENQHLDKWQRAGVVVTADCDLANNKHAGIVSYVPVLPLKEYLAHRLLPRYAEDQRQRHLKSLTGRIRELEQGRGAGPGLSSRAIEAWAAQADGAAELIEHFGPLPAETQRLITAAVTSVQKCTAARHIDDYDEMFALLETLQPSTTKSRKTAADRLNDDILNRLRNLPGDSFFMSSLGADHTGGFVAYLRLVREIRSQQIALSYHDQSLRGVVAKRISRLRAPYVYRLTQLLAEVFAAIGLPDEYEESRAAVFEACLRPLTPAGAA